MSFEATVQSADLVRELHAADKIIARKTTIPVLSNVLLEIADGAVHVSATDQDVAMRGRCDSPGASGEAVTLPARRLFELVRSWPSSVPVKLAAKATAVTVTAGQFKATLQTLPANDFPTLPTAPSGSTVNLSRAFLRDAIRKVRFACDVEDARFYLTGAKLEVDGTKARLIATDSYRLAVAEWGAVGHMADVIIPRRTLDSLVGLIDADGPDVTYSRGENHVFFTTDKRVLISRIIDAQFPQYRMLIPQPASEVTCERAALQAAARRLATITDLTRRMVVLDLSPNLLKLSARSADVGEATEELEVGYSGSEMQIGLNVYHLLDMIDVIHTERLVFSARAADRPLLCRTVDAGIAYDHVIMPMRV